jgi:hypothetical protein
MRMTAIHAQTERKRQDGSVRCAEKPGGYRRMTPVDDLIRPNRPPRTAVAAISSTERLTRRPRQPILTLYGRPHGKCRATPLGDVTEEGGHISDERHFKSQRVFQRWLP